ncbi:MAG: peptidase M61, partial [Betaproteobacteria bacterium]|nr:peptidase M61 [Betaproteobacteria bacterium]
LLVQQAYKLFDSHHYDHYDFLLSLSDKMGGQGLEHHQSSEDSTFPGYFTEWDSSAASRDLLSHEYTHSWNGKFRRPADLWTPNFNVPMRDSLLWVYEGQTQYWGFVLTARAGLWTHQQALDAFALTAATYDHHVGHEWRPLEDTTNDPIIAHRAPIPWRNYQLSEDYYEMGQLTWLDADTLIRKLSGGTRSLDDFAKAFFGVDNGSYVTHTYTFDDIVKALNAVQPYDWAKFLHDHLDVPAKGAPLDGIGRGGYRLVYTDTESAFEKGSEKVRKYADFSFSLGFTVGKDGELTTVLWGSPAFDAGLTVGTKLVALDDDAYDNDNLKATIRWAENHKNPITLLVEQNKHFRTVTIDYHGGLRYPHLEAVGTGPRSLDAILTPR